MPDSKLTEVYEELGRLLARAQDEYRHSLARMQSEIDTLAKGNDDLTKERDYWQAIVTGGVGSLPLENEDDK
jgi:hypothetical protein